MFYLDSPIQKQVEFGFSKHQSLIRRQRERSTSNFELGVGYTVPVIKGGDLNLFILHQNKEQVNGYLGKAFGMPFDQCS